MKKLLIIVILGLALCGCNSVSTNYKDVTCDEKNQILEKNKQAVLIDVRTKAEFDEKHLDNAINIPYDEIIVTLEKNDAINTNTPIIVYCKSGGRSITAATSLIEKGYTKIYNLGAISNCKE